jgi:NlpC/P60 family putative phage cell wall peptidase
MGNRVLAIARTFLGTPYRHQGATKGAGCDCLGLIRGVWRELYGAEAEAPPPYRPDWAEVCAAEPMLEAARRWLAERPVDAAAPGDVLLFRMSPAAAIKHCAILSAAPTPHDPHPRMIHAYWGRAVVESWVGPWWRRRLVGAFSFPAQPLARPTPVIPAAAQRNAGTQFAALSRCWVPDKR